MSCSIVQPTNGDSPHAVASFCKGVNNTPLSDALGPYPDEVIMTVLDRILYYSGATKIYHQLELAAMTLANAPPAALSTKSSCTSIGSDSGAGKCSSNTSQSRYDSARSAVKCKSPTVCCNPPKTSSLKSKCTIARCGTPVSCPRLRTPRVDFAHPVCDVRQKAGGPINMSDRMKHSISACSIAYRRLKTKLSGNFREHGQKWLWTRLVRIENGCHVYEVYKSSNMDRPPTQLAGAKEPVVVFLVMPNGHVMPFEALSTF